MFKVVVRRALCSFRSSRFVACSAAMRCADVVTAAMLLGAVFVTATASNPRHSFFALKFADAAEPQTRSLMTLDVLMTRFRASPGLVANFREEKRIALLADPLVSTGVVYYAPPRRFARQTSSPSVASLVLDGDKLTFSGAGSDAPQSMDLRGNAIASAFVDGFLGVIAGDRAALDRNFVLDFHANDAAHPGDDWDVSLVPRSNDVKKILREVRFKGDGIVVNEMRVLETSGDESTTTFRDVDPAHHFSADEASNVFRIRK
jgi:hypothetical protein